jgi:hypothetical protein
MDARHDPDKRSPDGLRIQDLNRFFRYQYGTQLPDDDAGREDMRVMFEHMVRLNNHLARMKAFASLWAAWMPPDEIERLIFEVNFDAPRYYGADELGDIIGLTDAVRTRLGITTIGGNDFDKEQRADRRKAKKAEDERERRRRLKALVTAADETVARAQTNRPAIDTYDSEYRLALDWVIANAGVIDWRGKAWHPLKSVADSLRERLRSPSGRPLDLAACARKLSRIFDDLSEDGWVEIDYLPSDRSPIIRSKLVRSQD